MSGTVRGVVDIATNQATEYQNTGDIFKAFFDAIEAHPNTTRIALQYGNGGTGTDRWDGASPFGQNCFAVWRMETSGARTWPWYFTMHCANGGGSSATWGAAPGDPLASEQSTASSTAYLGFQAAIGIGGDQNPWNGGTANDGTDSRAGSAALPLGSDGTAAVWRTPASGGTNLMVFPRSNNSGGTYDAGKQDMCVLINHGNPDNSRAHLIMDDDSIYAFWDEDDVGGSLMTYVNMGIFDPHPGISTYDRPFYVWRSQGAFSESATTERSGGLAVPDSSELTPVLQLALWSRRFHDGNAQPNAVFAPAEYDTAPGEVLMWDGSRKGFAGTTQDVFQICYDVPRNSANAAKTIGVLGVSANASLKVALKWTGVGEPGATTTREGVPF
jgi:hypothetical protein